MKKTITKSFEFCYAHRLEDPTLDNGKNEEVYGKCFLDSHGHNSVLSVSISGEEKNGMIINFTKLKDIVNDCVINVFDHHNINNLKEMNGRIPTCESMIDVIWDLIDKALISCNGNNVRLEKLKLSETDNSFCEVSRE